MPGSSIKSRDRVKAAIELDIADRPAAGFWGHDYLREWDPDALARSHIERQRRFGWDFVKFQPRATCFAEAYGAQYAASGVATQSPRLIRPAISNPQDWSDVETVSSSVDPLADQVDALRLVVQELGPEVPVIQTVFSPLSVADYMFGHGRLSVSDELRRNPEKVGAAMSAIVPTLIQFARHSIEAGAAGIFYAVTGFASADQLTYQEYEEWLLLNDLEILQALPESAWFNVLHLCGAEVHFGLASILPAHAISWDVNDRANPNLAEGIERTGRAAMGGIAQKTTVVSGTYSEIQEQVYHSAKSNDGRGIFVGPGCSVPPGIPESNLSAILEAMRPL